MVSRFILNLRQIDRDDVNETSRNGTLIFRSPTVPIIMGNMGESLEFGHEQDTDQLEQDEQGDIDEYSRKVSDVW